MSNDKQFEGMVKDIDEATRFASRIIMEETKAFVKENHRYHSKNDFDIAHKKSMQELEAEYLISKGYRKASEVVLEVIDDITDCYVQMIEEADNTIEEAILGENNTMARIARYGKDVMLLTLDTLTKKLKKKYTEERDNGT